MGARRGIGDGAAMPGRRHSWRFVSGHMEPELLCWLRAEAGESLLSRHQKFERRQRLDSSRSTTWVLAGAVSDQCFSKSLNGL